MAGAFFYYNYKFSQFKFIDFSQTILYTKNDIFTPKQDNYYMLIFSSKMDNVDKLLSKIPKDYPILVIDFYGKKFKNRKNIIFVRSGTNTIIEIIQKFNIYKIPLYFKIKRYNKTLFKQDSNKEHLKEI